MHGDLKLVPYPVGYRKGLEIFSDLSCAYHYIFATERTLAESERLGQEHTRKPGGDARNNEGDVPLPLQFCHSDRDALFLLVDLHDMLPIVWGE